MVCHAVSKGRVGRGPLNDSEEQEVFYIFIFSEHFIPSYKSNLNRKVLNYINIRVYVHWSSVSFQKPGVMHLILVSDSVWSIYT